MKYGILSGILWALDTVILGVVLATSSFTSSSAVIFLAPFISTCLHDTFSSIIMIAKTVHKGLFSRTIESALHTDSGKWIILASVVAGPLGMSAYVASIKFMGPSYTAIVSSLYPALGTLLSVVILKEKMHKYQYIGLTVSVLGVILLGVTPNTTPVNNLILGITSGVICCISWSLEAVIIAYGLKDESITSDQALTIRQTTSSLFYGVIIITLLGAWHSTLSIISTPVTLIILLSAVLGTYSYLNYYKAISKIGASRSMALNITYTAWSVVFSFIILGTVPTVTSILYGLMIVLGSLVASIDIDEITIFLNRLLRVFYEEVDEDELDNK